jgi:competence protein ComEC
LPVAGDSSPSALGSALGRQMPFWDRSIDLAVLTHPDAGHITALPEVLDRFGRE